MISTLPLTLRASIVLFFPFCQLIFLRFFLHSVLGLRVGFPGFTDYELFFPAPLGFIAFLIALEQEKTIQVAFRFQGLVLNSILLFLFIGLSYFHTVFPANSNYFLWWLTLVAMLISAFFVWIEPKSVFLNKNFWTLIPSLIMVFSLVIYFKWGNLIWSSMLKPLEWGVRELLALSGNELIRSYAGRRFLQVQHPLWTVHVGQGCGGFDALNLFSSAYTIFSTLMAREIKASVLVFYWLVGVVFFWGLNICRILVIFSLGIYCIRLFGKNEGSRWALGLFHSHSGYVLYTLGLISYFLSLKSLFARNRFSEKAAKNPTAAKTIHNPI